MPFISLLNKGFKTFLPLNPFHHIAQVIPPKKVDKCTKGISKKFKDLNQLFDNTENTVNCDYLDINEYKKIKVKEQDFSLLHLKMSSLSSYVNGLKTLFSQVDTKFDINCILESQISKKNSLTADIDIPGYNIEHTPTESSAGESLIIYVTKLSYKAQ